MSISDILDESWIQEQQRIHDIKHNYYREKYVFKNFHFREINDYIWFKVFK